MHWTHSFAKQNFEEGKGRYTLFKRSGKNHRSFDDIMDYVKVLKSLYETLSEERLKEFEDSPRIALNPQENGHFLVMRYPEDGTYWVTGFLIDGSRVDLEE